ncbi:hypothetical protein ACI7BZ_00690 [Xanthobacter sp. AM11]|uniref:hypothetical protein n=1 Tax=Xanthobacter sp. AM11 TaxID=3380643 RepID=UPI0039BFCD0F
MAYARPVPAERRLVATLLLAGTLFLVSVMMLADVIFSIPAWASAAQGARGAPAQLAWVADAGTHQGTMPVPPRSTPSLSR